MTVPAASVLSDLFPLFPPASFLQEHRFVPAELVPPPYQQLLVHEHHMTVTVEAHHGDLVNVHVLETKTQGDVYARKILLSLQKTGKVVQFGLVRIHLNYVSPEVRAQILSQRTPLGRILIEHDVLRRIEPTGFLRVIPGPDMMKWFDLESPKPTYGRTALIYCDAQPAVELLEILAPEP